VSMFSRFRQSLKSRLSSGQYRRRKFVVERLEERRVLATFVVTSLIDGPLAALEGDGQLSLREAIEAANSNTSIDGSPVGEDGDPAGLFIRDLITFAPGLEGELLMTAGEFHIADWLEINGPLTINANQQSRIFNVFGGENLGGPWLRNLTLVNGRATLANSDGNGGAIRSDPSFLMSDVNILNSYAELDGGGIYAHFVSSSYSTIAGNMAGGNGGGIYATTPQGSIRSSTIAMNQAANGGGVYYAATTRSTFSQIYYSTIAGNVASEAGGGVYLGHDSGVFWTIIAGNTLTNGDASDASGKKFRTQGIANSNLLGAKGDSGLNASANILNVDWKTVLENDGTKPILADHGGPTLTIALADGSPAIDYGDSMYLPALEQRGFKRYVDGNHDGTTEADIGALEQEAEIVRVSIRGNTQQESASFLTFTIELDRSIPAGETLTVDVDILPTSTATAGVDFEPVFGTLTFMPGGSKTQTIQMPLIDDGIVESEEAVRVELKNVVGGVIEVANSTAIGRITDDEVGSISLSKTEVVVSEDGFSITEEVTAVLDVEPDSTVFLDISTARNLLPGATASENPLDTWKRLTFTPQNWSVPQAFTVRGKEDNADPENDTRTLNVAVTAGPTGYWNAGRSINVTVLDNDVRGIRAETDAATTSEAGQQAAINFSLTSYPYSETFPYVANVVLGITSSDPTEGTVDIATLTFTGQNWDIPQTVTVSGVDDNEADGNVAYKITATVLSGVHYRVDPREVALKNIDNEMAAFDFGDAPTATQSGFASSYPTTLSEDAARHLVDQLFLGTAVDAEVDGEPSNGSNASVGDNAIGQADEDGVTLFTSLIASPTTNTVSSIAVTASAPGKLDAWIDFNRDGDWSDVSEQIFVSSPLVAGLNVLSLTIPAGAALGETYSRFRFSSSGGLSPMGQASDGEVEDYLLTIVDHTSAIVYLNPPLPGTFRFAFDNSDMVATWNGLELLRAPAAGLQLKVTGTDADDTFFLTDTITLGSQLRLDGGEGENRIQVVGGGHHLNLAEATATEFSNIDSIDIRDGANLLSLSLTSVAQAVGTTSLRIVHDERSEIDYGSGWTVENPTISNGIFLHQLTQGNARVQIENTRAFQNPYASLDTNRSTNVTAVDVLLILNRINSDLDRNLTAPTTIDPANEWAYVDSDGNNLVSPLDVLLVINAINSAGSGEGEVSEIPTFAFAPPVEKTKTDLQAATDELLRHFKDLNLFDFEF
jgi:hypothetical protein